MEEALFLTRFGKNVTIVHRRSSFRASKIMSDRVLAHPGIEVVWNSHVLEVLGAEKTEALRLRNVETGVEQTIDADALFVAIGHEPNTAPFKSAADIDDQGYFVPTGHSQVKTRTPGLYVAGDCADHGRRGHHASRQL